MIILCDFNNIHQDLEYICFYLENLIYMCLGKSTDFRVLEYAVYLVNCGEVTVESQKIVWKIRVISQHLVSTYRAAQNIRSSQTALPWSSGSVYKKKVRWLCIDVIIDGQWRILTGYLKDGVFDIWVKIWPRIWYAGWICFCIWVFKLLFIDPVGLEKKNPLVTW